MKDVKWTEDKFITTKLKITFSEEKKARSLNINIYKNGKKIY